MKAFSQDPKSNSTSSSEKIADDILNDIRISYYCLYFKHMDFALLSVKAINIKWLSKTTVKVSFIIEVIIEIILRFFCFFCWHFLLWLLLLFLFVMVFFLELLILVVLSNVELLLNFCNEISYFFHGYFGLF